MTSRREQRVAFLRDELQRVMQELTEALTGARATVFLDRLARLEAYLPAELARTGAEGLVAAGRDVRAAEGSVLGDWAASCLDLEGLLARAEDIAGGAEDDVRAFALEALLVAGAAPWLAGKARGHAHDVLQRLVALVDAVPAAFEGAADVALDRILHERPSRQEGQTAELLEVLAQAPDQVDDDAEAPALPESAVHTLESVLREARGPSILARLVAALPGTPDWLERARELLSPQPALAWSASAAAVRPHLLLLRREAGELLLVQDQGQPALEWLGTEPPALSLQTATGVAELTGTDIAGGRRWPLPGRIPAEGATLVARFGPNVLRVELPGPARA